METNNRLLDYLREHSRSMVNFLRRLALIESPSAEPASQGPVLDILPEALVELGYVVRLIPGRKSGGHLYARPQKQRGRERHGPVQLLLGHCDTVWPLGTLEVMPIEVGEGLVRGPGVYDMKGGLTQMVYALRALRALGLEPSVSPVVFINSDEEVGSRESKRHVRRLARVADRVFVLEPSLGGEGKLKTARKGAGRFSVTIEGRAAHAESQILGVGFRAGRLTQGSTLTLSAVTRFGGGLLRPCEKHSAPPTHNTFFLPSVCRCYLRSG